MERERVSEGEMEGKGKKAIIPLWTSMLHYLHEHSKALIKVTLIWKQLYITSNVVQSLFLQREKEREPILISIILIALHSHMVVYMLPQLWV